MTGDSLKVVSGAKVIQTLILGSDYRLDIWIAKFS